MEKTEIQALIDSLGITYKVVFVPFSKSRNAKEKNVSLNWLVTIEKGRQSLTTDYMQGIGHFPNYANSLSRNAAYDRYIKECIECGKYAKNVTGKTFHSVNQVPMQAIPAPDLIDVLYSLAVDSEVIDYSGFEDWAENFGYDVDSRKAEKTYRDCLEIALKLRSMLGDDNIAKLREAYQDY